MVLTHAAGSIVGVIPLISMRSILLHHDPGCVTQRQRLVTGKWQRWVYLLWVVPWFLQVSEWGGVGWGPISIAHALLAAHAHLTCTSHKGCATWRLVSPATMVAGLTGVQVEHPLSHSVSL